jgi:O-acetyl-ADP-ribose deacetylase (regulator of RNase III)
MKIIFFDLDKEKIDTYQKILKIINEKHAENHKKNFLHSHDEIKFDFLNEELSELVKSNKIDIIVSPANSYGTMTGGIDSDICKLDPSIQMKVKFNISKSIYLDMDKEPYIPVGLCEPVKITNSLSILIAPTMKHPKDITKTNNIFLAFNSILIYLKHLHNHNKKITVACPCLGTGCGAMNANKSAKQILHSCLIHQIA